MRVETIAPPKQEFRVTGPPGTGKTYYLTKQAHKACQKYSPQDIMITSLTNAAASEIASRNRAIPRQNVGTLHSLANRAIGKPDLVTDHISDWNSFCNMFPISRGFFDGDMDNQPSRGGAESEGDRLLSETNIKRLRMEDQSSWANDEIAFYEKWKAWKIENDLIDFVDMIYIALRDTDTAPGDPSVILADEVQDYSKLELTLLRSWAQHVDTFVIVGDPDQTIYEWRGADPTVFQTPEVSDEKRRILETSYRVPKEVVDYALSWIQQIGDRRDDVHYYPHDDNPVGEVRRDYWSLNSPDCFVHNELSQIIETTDETVMILASCSYMLKTLVYKMRDAAIPFHNPFKRKNGQWNPLHAGRGVSTVDRLKAFFRHHPEIPGSEWTDQDVSRFAEMLSASDCFVHGEKGNVVSMYDESEEPMPLNYDWLAGKMKDPEWVDDAVTQSALGNMEWFNEQLLNSWKSRRTMQYAQRIADIRGIGELEETPQVVVGTIHSVKGAEADHVYISPDLSKAAYVKNWSAGGERMDSVIRQFYVGMTRAKKTLNLLQPSKRYAVDWI